MTIDIHKVITGNPITKNSMKPWGSNKEKKQYLISIRDLEIIFQPR